MSPFFSYLFKSTFSLYMSQSAFQHYFGDFSGRESDEKLRKMKNLSFTAITKNNLKIKISQKLDLIG